MIVQAAFQASTVLEQACLYQVGFALLDITALETPRPQLSSSAQQDLIVGLALHHPSIVRLVSSPMQLESHQPLNANSVLLASFVSPKVQRMVHRPRTALLASSALVAPQQALRVPHPRSVAFAPPVTTALLER
jgi:hypothetical protein